MPDASGRRHLIPKIIHSVWLGPRPIPAQHQRWMARWREMHPDFVFMHWTEHNIDRQSEWILIALHRRQWACASDAIRLQALRKFGGIYLDTDVEVVRPLHPLLAAGCVVGWTSTRGVTHTVNNAVIAARSGHRLIERALTRTLAIDPWQVQEPGPPDALRDALLEYGPLVPQPESVRVDDVLIVPSRVFYPYDWTEAYHPSCIAPDTFCVHHWTLSWDGAGWLKQAVRALPGRRPWLRRAVTMIRHGWKVGRTLHNQIRRQIDQATYR